MSPTLRPRRSAGLLVTALLAVAAPRSAASAPAALVSPPPLPAHTAPTSPPDAEGVAAECDIIVEISGSYRIEITQGSAPLPKVEYKNSSGPVTEVVREDNPGLCDQHPISGQRTPSSNVPQTDADIQTRDSGNLDERFAQVVQQFVQDSRWRYQEGQGITDADFHRMVRALYNDRIAAAAGGVLSQIEATLRKLFLTYYVPNSELARSALLTNAGLQFIGNTAMNLLVRAYVEGRDPDALIDGLLSDMVKHLTSQPGVLIKEGLGPEAGGAIERLLKPHLDEASKVIIDELDGIEPDQQEAYANYENDDCTWRVEMWWDPKGGDYSGRFRKRCGEREEPSATAVITAPTLEPGEAGTVTVQAVDATGVPYPLSSATIDGLVPVMPDGTTDDPAAVFGAGSRTATFAFTAGDPRKDGPYQVQVEMTTFNGLPARDVADVVVTNVAPSVESVTPASVTAEPGGPIRLDARVVVRDANADDDNPDEVDVEGITLGDHPPALRVSEADGFSDADHVERTDHDPTSGTYEFRIRRDGGTVERPHEHCTRDEGCRHETLVTAADEASDDAAPVGFHVRDTPPRITELSVTPDYVMPADDQPVRLQVTFEDDNGWEDILAASTWADVTEASEGMGRLLLEGDLQVVDGDGAVLTAESVPFTHTDVTGEHPVPFHVEDERSSADDDGSLFVGNTAPRIGANGFIYGSPGAREDEGEEPGDDPGADPEGGDAAGGPRIRSEPPARLCPGDSFTAGAVVRDDHDHPFRVTATIVETGATAVLRRPPLADTHTGELEAPAAPGDYTLRIEAAEPETLDEAMSSSVEHTLHVDPCEPAQGAGQPAEPEEPVAGEEAEDEQPEEGDPGGPLGEETPEPESEEAGALGWRDLSLSGTYGSDVSIDDAVQRMRLGGATITVEPAASGGGARRSSVATPISGLASRPEPGALRSGPSAALIHAAAPPPAGSAVTSVVAGLGAPEVEAYLVGSGRATGDAFQLHVLNGGDDPITIDAAGLTVEPVELAEDARSRLLERLRSLPSEGGVQMTLEGYCLDRLRLPPAPGQLFRVAGPELQRRFAPAGDVLRAAERLAGRGGLHPDSDPTGYAQSIKQWAIWTEQEGFDLEGFREAFVERTRETFEKAGRAWTEQVEDAVRGLAPNRWSDIQAVLELVDGPESGGSR